MRVFRAAVVALALAGPAAGADFCIGSVTDAPAARWIAAEIQEAFGAGLGGCRTWLDIRTGETCGELVVVICAYRVGLPPADAMTAYRATGGEIDFLWPGYGPLFWRPKVRVFTGPADDPAALWGVVRGWVYDVGR